ncbi:MAG: hypothetical protein J6R42_04480 [Clostridia bacterium]|nr:hypothetical protein [Clostridia bacterium]
MLYISEKNNIVIDVTKPPYNADNTGRHDCTQALRRAMDDVLIRELEGVRKIRQKLLDDPRENCFIGFENRKMKGVPTVIFPEDVAPARIIYFPEGTYLISDTITYSIVELCNLIGDKPASDINRFIHFKGAGMDKVTIKLADHCYPFRYGEIRPMISFCRNNNSNINWMNTFEDITIDAGVGNPGAVGLRFHSANTGKIHNVTIRSSDPDHVGYAAIMMDLCQENYHENIHIDGFKYGIYSTGAGHSRAFENVYMDHILTCGVHSENGIVGLHHATIRTYGAAANANWHTALSLVDVKMVKLGERGGNAVTTRVSCTYMRHFSATGFDTVITSGFEPVLAGDGEWEEYNSEDREFRLFPTDRHYIELEVLPQPRYEWNGDRSIVAEVDDYGAVGDGVTDSTAAIQAAMNSGKEYIVFGEGRYFCSAEIKIPKTVKAINFMYCDFAVERDFGDTKETGLFVIEEESDDILYMDDCFAFEKFYGYIRFVRHSARRDLAISDMQIQTAALYFNTVPGSRVWLENVASTMGSLGGNGYGVLPNFHFRGQTVWARNYNPERSKHNSLCEEGTKIWIFGFKTEGPAGRGFTFRSGSIGEAICGDATIALDDGTPCVEIEEASAFIFLRTQGCGPHHQFAVAVREVQNGCERSLLPEKMPAYHVEYYFIPGFIAIHKD